MIERRKRHVEVSDHAVLRWLERVEGVDVKALRRRISRAARNAAEHGAGGVRVEGVDFRISYHEDDNAVVTTTNSKHTRPHLAQPRNGPQA